MNSNRYNEKRRRLLEKLDKGEYVSTIELGMYDLTPYFNLNEEDANLSALIMLNRNYERKVEHTERELYFSPPQYDALKCLFEKDRVILSAPTSFGKTLLIKEYIYRKKPHNIVYIVPTNALAYELEKSFKENKAFSEYVIFDKSPNTSNRKEENKEKLFFIGTQEKYLEIEQDLIGMVDLFVIDEAYKLQESIKSQRSYKLSETFLSSVTNTSQKVFLLTPKAILDGFEKYNFYEFKSDFNAVEKNYVILEGDAFFSKLLKKGASEKTILFCNSPRQINEGYEAIKQELDSTRRTEFSALLESEIHPDWSVVKLLNAGILTHHGQMPKYVQNRMINLFNESDEYHILFGTNSISEGINTVTKNLFIHPEYNGAKDILLLKNTIGRAGRLGEYPIGYIYSITDIKSLVDNEIVISLAISDEEELSEIVESKNEEMILEFSEEHNLEFELCQELIKTHKLSLRKLGRILTALKKDCKYSGITNLPYIARDAFVIDYNTNADLDKILIKGWLQSFYLDDDKKRVYLNNYSDRILYFRKKSKATFDNTGIINLYMQFVYSTLEYCIMPIVNIGLSIKERQPDWKFGINVLESLEECKNKYYSRTYGWLNVDSLSDSHRLIIAAMKDYGMTSMLKNLNEEILTEIEGCLNVRYSTLDVIRAINYLAKNSGKHKGFYQELKKKYMI